MAMKLRSTHIYTLCNLLTLQFFTKFLSELLVSLSRFRFILKSLGKVQLISSFWSLPSLMLMLLDHTAGIKKHVPLVRSVCIVYHFNSWIQTSLTWLINALEHFYFILWDCWKRLLKHCTVSFFLKISPHVDCWNLGFILYLIWTRIHVSLLKS